MPASKGPARISPAVVVPEASSPRIRMGTYPMISVPGPGPPFFFFLLLIFCAPTNHKVKLRPAEADGWSGLGHCYWKKPDLFASRRCFLTSLEKVFFVAHPHLWRYNRSSRAAGRSLENPDISRKICPRRAKGVMVRVFSSIQGKSVAPPGT